MSEENENAVGDEFEGAEGAEGAKPEEGGEIKKDVSLDERMLSLLEKIYDKIGGGEVKADGEEGAEKDPLKMPDSPLPAFADSEKEEGEKKEEKAYADAQIQLNALKKELDALKRAQPRHRTADEYDQLAAAQLKAENHYMAFGDSVAKCRPMDGETVDGYRKRMLKGLQKHSDKFAKTDLAKIDGEVLDHIEEVIYADSMAAARSPTAAGLPNGLPRAIKSTDEDGRHVTHYVGGQIGATFEPWRQKPRNLVAMKEQRQIH